MSVFSERARVSDWKVRVGAAADREAVLDLWLELVEYHRSLDPDYPPTPGLRATLRREVDRALAEPGCELSVAVARAPGEIVGFAIAEIDPRPSEEASEGGTCWIHELYVAPPARDRGVGRALVRSCERFFARSGAERATVRVEIGNAAGLRFWERVGYVERARVLDKSLPER